MNDEVRLDEKIKHKIHYSYIDGIRHVSYTFNSSPVVHTELQGPSVNLAKKYQFGIKELEVSAACLQRLIEIYEDNLHASLSGRTIQSEDTLNFSTMAQALFSTATIAYGKLFMSVGSGRKQYAQRDFFHREGVKFLPLDAWWMSVRNVLYSSLSKCTI